MQDRIEQPMSRIITVVPQFTLYTDSIADLKA